jgi:hypothetical protein
VTKKQCKQMVGWLSIPVLIWVGIFGLLYLDERNYERNFPAGDFPRYNDRGFGGGRWKVYGGLWLVERSQEELLRLEEFDPGYVKLWRCTVNPDIARSLAGKQSIRQVELNGCKNIDEQFYLELSRSEAIDRLLIRECSGLTDSCASYLAAMASLEDVWVSECDNITDEFVLAFISAPSLVRFRIDRSPGVSAESMAALKAFGVDTTFFPHESRK